MRGATSTGRLRWCTERGRLVVEFWLARATLAVAHCKDAPTSSASISVELTVDAGDDMVRIEVRDDDASLPGTGRVVSLELREASTAV